MRTLGLVRVLQPAPESAAVSIAVRSSGPTAGRYGQRGGGDAVPVVLIHGMAGDHRTWRATAAALRAVGRTVITFDLRGHGSSARADSYRLDDFVADLAFVLDELAIERADIVGHSLGAHTALRYAMTAPQRVRSLVLEEIPPMPQRQEQVDEGIAVGAGLGERLRGLVVAMADPRPLLRFHGRIANEVAGQFETVQPQWWADLSVVDVPALVISGGPRSFLPARHLHTLAQALPQGRFETIATGHSVHRDRFSDFRRVLVGFLAGIERAEH